MDFRTSKICCKLVMLLIFSGYFAQVFAEKTVSKGLPRLPFNPVAYPHQRYAMPHHPHMPAYNPYMPPRIAIKPPHPLHVSHDPNAINERYVSPLRAGSEYSKTAPSVITFRSPGINPHKIQPQTKHHLNSSNTPALEQPGHETIPKASHQVQTETNNVDEDRVKLLKSRSQSLIKFLFQEFYDFGYAVKDDLNGDDFSHQVTNDGRKTEGEYRVALSDGRVQVFSII